MRRAFAGVDVAFARGKRLPIVLCSWREDRLVPEPLRDLEVRPPRGSGNAATLDEDVVRRFARDAAEYLRAVSDRLGLEIVRIGIDAPSGPCAPGRPRRAAEQGMDRAGIRCFATPSAEEFAAIRRKVAAHLRSGGRHSHIPHANQLWMLAGFALYEELSKLAPCLEVFPQATARALGAGGTHKLAAGGVDEQLRAAAQHTGWPPPGEQHSELAHVAWGSRHDRLDAYLAAWVAALDEEDRVPYGSPPDDVIWVPRLAANPTFAGLARAPERDHLQVNARDGSGTAHSRSCPACRELEFKRWPWGWDAHAAHTCIGLEATDPEERKHEYRRRFGHLFR